MILVTGSRGFIGSQLVKKFPCVTIDLRDGQNLLTCELPKDIDLIYHLAAQTSVEASWHDPLHDLDNVKMVARLVKEYPNAKIIYANSCASKDSPYGFSKQIGAEYLKIFHNNWVSCVFPNIYGGGNGVVDLFSGKDKVTIYGDGLQTRDFVHIDDIIEGLIQADYWTKGEYFMGSEKGTTILELAKGKEIFFAPARKEEREVIVRNTTPSWQPIINVLTYIK